jgi:hypothetical protein
VKKGQIHKNIFDRIDYLSLYKYFQLFYHQCNLNCSVQKGIFMICSYYHERLFKLIYGFSSIFLLSQGLYIVNYIMNRNMRK